MNAFIQSEEQKYFKIYVTLYNFVPVIVIYSFRTLKLICINIVFYIL